LAVGTDRGVVLADLARGADLGFLPIGRAQQVLFERSGDLLTGGAAGVMRWPIRLDAGRGEWRIGPPLRLPLPASSMEEMAEDQSGRIVALSRGDRAFVATPERTFQVGPIVNG